MHIANAQDIEEIDPRNVSISFVHSSESQDCVTRLYATNDQGIDIAVSWGILAWKWGSKSQQIQTTPYMFIHLAPDPKAPGKDLTWSAIIFGSIKQVLGFGEKPLKGWIDVGSYSSENDFKNKNFTLVAPLTPQTISIQSQIILDEQPFILAFQNYKSEKIYKFKINPKGLIKKKDKESVRVCESQFLVNTDK